MIKRFARAIFGDYAIYYVYGISQDVPFTSAPRGRDCSFSALGRDELATSSELLIREQAGYLGPEATAYGCAQEGDIVATCHYWYGDRYRTRNFWPLAEDEAKLVQIVTAPRARGQGIATALIAHSTNEMFRLGFKRLYARIWHSNGPSLSAFERAGWRRVALVIEITPFGRRRPSRLRLRWRSLPQRTSTGDAA